MKENHSPQENIENFMAEVIKFGNYEPAYLMSEEGLTLAHSFVDEIVPEERLIEMAVIFQNIQKMADVMAGIYSITSYFFVFFAKVFVPNQLTIKTQRLR